MAQYTMATTLDKGYDEAVADARAALADVGFGILTEIDLRATFKNKLDVDIPAQIILGACRPPLAYRATTAEPSVATLLPCNVVVRSVGDDRTVVEIMDPRVMDQLTVAPEITEVAAEARELLTKALDSLGGERTDA